MLLAGYSFASPKDIRQNSAVIDALKYYHGNQIKFERIGSESGISAQLVYSIVAPEIAQFNAFSNVFETLSLKLMYVQKGSGFFDFSIGLFQMKPSFVEALEQYVTEHPLPGTDVAGILINEPDLLKQRTERIRRLKSDAWQYRYLQLFLKIVVLRLGNQLPENDKDKLSILATAYNSGFLKDISQLRRQMRFTYFPVYSPFRGYSYSKVSLIFYQLLS